MLLPTRKLLLLLLAPAAFWLVYPWRCTTAVAIGCDVAVLLAAAICVGLSPRAGQIRIERQLPEHLSLGAKNQVGWEVRNLSGSPLQFELTEDVPDSFERDVPSVSGVLYPRSSATVCYAVEPSRRGHYVFGDIFLRWHTHLGLVVRQKRFPTSDEVKVYPNVSNLARYELAAQRHRISEIGLRPVRLRGRGSMFESLRDYVPGDDLADAAWKATARHNRIMIRNYETERSQNVLVVLDCGRLMAPQVDRLSRLDCAINAALLLTYAAMKQGDHIGLVAFSDRIESYVPAMKGRAALQRMNDALYRLEPRLCESDYEGVCKYLALRHRKRSLIVILTDVVDRETSSTLLAYASRFAKYHLPLCVTLRNLDVERMADAEPRCVSDCFSTTMALRLLNRRAEVLGHMRQSGVDVLDADPRQLTPQLLNRYLLLKARNRF